MVFKLGQWLRYVDDLDGARACLAEAEQAARDEGDESSLANILLNRVSSRPGPANWDDAAGLTERMSDAFEQHGSRSGRDRSWRAYVDAHGAALDAVRATVGDSPPGEPIIAMIWSRCLGLAELAAGETEAADRHLSEAIESSSASTSASRRSGGSTGTRSRRRSAVGELERAERLLARFEERAARSQIPWSLAVSARCRGLCSPRGGELEARPRALERALAEHERCPMPFERARTLLVQGQVFAAAEAEAAGAESLEAARGDLRQPRRGGLGRARRRASCAGSRFGGRRAS